MSYKLHNNLGGFVYHSLLFHVRPADQSTITYVALGHKKGWTPIFVAILWITKNLIKVETCMFQRPYRH